jgi:superfamily II DNA or RNA helicase
MSITRNVEIKEPRPYQSEAIETIRQELYQGVSKQLVVLPTGAGKTYLAIKAVNDNMPYGGRLLWIAHTQELLEQSGAAMLEEMYPQINIKGLLKEHGGLIKCFKAVRKTPDKFKEEDLEILNKIGIVKAENFDIDCDIVLASAQTLWRRLDQIPRDTFSVVVVDECHLAGAKTFVQSIQHFEPELLMGLTATPYRKDGMPLGNIFDKMVFKYGLKDAIRDGYLVELDAIQCQTNLSLDTIGDVGGELNQGELTEVVDTPQRNRLIVEKYLQYADGQQNIVYCVDRKHAVNVMNAFLEAGLSCECIVGDETITPDRQGAIERFKSGETRIVTNCQILTTGFDHPPLACITMACPTKSLTKYMQSIGRGTRTLPGVLKPGMTKERRLNKIENSKKPHCTILDIVDNSSKHSLVNTFTLDKTNLPLDKIFMTKKKREEAEGKRLAIEMAANKNKDKKIDLFEVPEVILPDFSPWMKLKPTDRQIVTLKKNGRDTDKIDFTRGMASKIIGELPALPWCRQKMKAWGFNVTGKETYGQYLKAKEEYERREAKKKRQNGEHGF